MAELRESIVDPIYLSQKINGLLTEATRLSMDSPNIVDNYSHRYSTDSNNTIIYKKDELSDLSDLYDRYAMTDLPNLPALPTDNIEQSITLDGVDSIADTNDSSDLADGADSADSTIDTSNVYMSLCEVVEAITTDNLLINKAITTCAYNLDIVKLDIVGIRDIYLDDIRSINAKIDLIEKKLIIVSDLQTQIISTRNVLLQTINNLRSTMQASITSEVSRQLSI
jgi:hypothetical protein